MDAVISSLSSLPTPGAAEAPAKGRNELGKDEFLRLLTTQLTAQDPLSPMDSQAFVAQLAQFASVEQLQGLGTRLDTMLVGQAASNQMGVANLVGKEVTYRTDRVTIAGDGRPAPFQVSLDGAADDGVAIVADASGRVVRTIPLGAHDAGAFAVPWDGLDDSGQPLPAGSYSLTISATKDGEPVGSHASVRGTVSGVTFDSGAPQLVIGGGRVSLADVVEISSLPTP